MLATTFKPLLHYKIIFLPLREAFYKSMQLGWRQLLLVCHAITTKNGRTFCQMGAKGLAIKQCTTSDMMNITSGCRYESLSQIVSENIPYGFCCWNVKLKKTKRGLCQAYLRFLLKIIFHSQILWKFKQTVLWTKKENWQHLQFHSSYPILCALIGMKRTWGQWHSFNLDYFTA